MIYWANVFGQLELPETTLWYTDMPRIEIRTAASVS